MSVTVTPQANGGSFFTVLVHLEQDGEDKGELKDYVIVDPAEFGLPKYPSLKLWEAWSSLVWFDVILKFGGLHPRPVWVFSREASAHPCFASIGGLADRGESPPSDDNGKILLSTSGFDVPGSQGTLLLHFKK